MMPVIRYCKPRKHRVAIEEKFKNIFEGRNLVETRWVGYYWETCSEKCGAKCHKTRDLLEIIESERA